MPKVKRNPFREAEHGFVEHSTEWILSADVVESNPFESPSVADSAADSAADVVQVKRPHYPRLEAVDVSDWAQVRDMLRHEWGLCGYSAFSYLYLSCLVHRFGVPDSVVKAGRVLYFVDSTPVHVYRKAPALTAQVEGIRIIDGAGIVIPVYGQAYLEANRIDTANAMRLTRHLEAFGVRSYLKVKVAGAAECIAFGVLSFEADSVAFSVIPTKESMPLCDYLIKALEGVVKM